MKKLIFLLIISASLPACKKEGSSRPPKPEYKNILFQVEEISIDGNIYLSETVKVN